MDFALGCPIRILVPAQCPMGLDTSTISVCGADIQPQFMAGSAFSDQLQCLIIFHHSYDNDAANKLPTKSRPI